MTSPRRPALPLATLALALTAFAGCGKVQEAASEKIAEKVIESAISREGGSAKVELGGDRGTVKAEGVDADGKAYKLEMGQATVSEKEVGVAFYPGAKASQGNRIANGDLQMVQVELLSADPVPKVTEWYRAQLKPRMGNGQQSMEQTTPESAMLMVSGEHDSSLVVNISKEGDAGSRISLMSSSKGGGGKTGG